MRSDDDVLRVLELHRQGLSKSAIARASGVSRTQVREWIDLGLAVTLSSPMRKRSSLRTCEGACRPSDLHVQDAYAYLLGIYLGDGWLTEDRLGLYKLRIAACDAYPAIRREIENAMQTVRPEVRVTFVPRVGCTELCSYSSHWLCLFPQHGRGRKHEREIVLAPWQRRIVLGAHTQPFLRGLVHADGCRSVNKVTRPTKSGPRSYQYPRYFFTNESAQILELFIEGCEALGIECRVNRRNSVSVAKRDSVAKMDGFIGPKR